MIMLGLPCRCSSRTQALARLNESVLVMSYTMIAAAAPLQYGRHMQVIRGPSVGDTMLLMHARTHS